MMFSPGLFFVARVSWKENDHAAPLVGLHRPAAPRHTLIGPGKSLTFPTLGFSDPIENVLYRPPKTEIRHAVIRPGTSLTFPTLGFSDPVFRDSQIADGCIEIGPSTI